MRDNNQSQVLNDSGEDLHEVSGFRGYVNNQMRDLQNQSVFDPQREIKHELNAGLQEIKMHLKERKKVYRCELKKRIEKIELEEKKLDFVSKKFKDRWLKIQKKTLFLSLLRQSLRKTRNFGIDPKKVPENASLIEESHAKKCSVIYPDAWYYKLHIFLMLSIMIYLIIFFPLDLAFNLNELAEGWRVVDTAITSYFALDIIVSLLTAYEDNGVLVESNKQIAKNYLLKWFLLDLITVIPLDLIFELDNFRYKRLLKAPRLMRLVNSMFQNTESKKKTRSFVAEKLKLIFSSSKTVNSVKYICLIAMFIHVSASCWYFLADALIENESGNWISK